MDRRSEESDTTADTEENAGYDRFGELKNAVNSGAAVILWRKSHDSKESVREKPETWFRLLGFSKNL